MKLNNTKTISNQCDAKTISNECDEAFMHEAIKQAKLAAQAGEVPIGAVVVYEPINPATRKSLAPPKIIAQSFNTREVANNPSGHAEFSAMLAACAEMQNWRLTDCTVYVTLEPCIMCAGLMQQSRIARCVFGAYDSKGGALGTLYNIHEDARLNHNFEVTPGVCEQDCATLLSDFFKERRSQNKKAKYLRRESGNCADINSTESENHGK